MESSFRVKIPGQPGIEGALNKVMEYMDSIAQLAGRDIVLGKGLRSPHGDSRALLIEGSSQSGQGGDCRQWVPSFTSVDGTPALVWRDGHINGVTALNIGQPVVYQNKGTFFILAKVTAGQGSVSAFEIIISTTNKAVYADSKGAPPSMFHALLGTIIESRVKMTVCRNLNVSPLETRRSAKSPDTIRDEPFDRWFRWKILDSSD